jgi:diaminopropionate ammonia-lyase
MFYNPSAHTWRYEGHVSDPEVQSFHRGLPDYAVSPLVSLPDVAKTLGLGHVLLKDESNRLGLPAFKILGASWAVFKTVATKFGLPLNSTLEEVATAARDSGIHLVTCTEGNCLQTLSRSCAAGM